MKRISDEELLMLKAELHCCVDAQQVYVVLSAFMHDGWDVLQITAGLISWAKDVLGVLMPGSEHVQEFMDNPEFGQITESIPAVRNACLQISDRVVQTVFCVKDLEDMLEEGEEWKA